jgi:hypothetical protein
MIFLYRVHLQNVRNRNVRPHKIRQTKGPASGIFLQIRIVYRSNLAEHGLDAPAVGLKDRPRLE